MNVLGKPLRLIFLCNQDNYKKKKQNPEQIRIKCKVFYSLCFQHSLKNAVLSLLCQVLTSKYSAIVFLSSLFKISNFCLLFFYRFDSLDSTLIIIVVVLNIILFLMAGLIFYSWKKYTNTSIYFRSRKSKPSRNPSTCSTKEHECIEIFTELN